MVLALWTGAEVISISIKLVSRWKHNVLQNLLANGCVDCGLQKTQDQHQQMTWQPKSSLTVETSHWTSRTWILCLSSLPPDSGTLIYKLNAKLLSSEKRTLEHRATVQFLFSLAQVRCFWRCFWFRSVLVALFLKMSERGDSWCTDSSFSSLRVKLSQVFESALLDRIRKLAVIPVTFAAFPPNFSLHSLLKLKCKYSNILRSWFLAFMSCKL